VLPVPLHPSHLLNIARKRARLTRERHGIAALGPVPDLVALAEERLRVPVVVAALRGEVDGAYLPADGGATVFLNGRRPLVRQRFTLAHELGHHVLGHGSSVDDARALEGDGWAGGQAMDERCANAFAAELLIPPDAAKAWAADAGGDPAAMETVVRFAAAFGVSASMACIRLRTAKLLDADAAAALLAAMEEHEHLALAETLDDLPVLTDTLAAVWADGGTRVPPAFAGSLGALRL
jgi:Zn-dependent peptidase ImmA (M78 family)